MFIATIIGEIKMCITFSCSWPNMQTWLNIQPEPHFAFICLKWPDAVPAGAETNVCYISSSYSDTAILNMYRLSCYCFCQCYM